MVKKIQIIHLAQIDNGVPENKGTSNTTILSQLEVAKTLKQYPNCPVVLECAHKNMNVPEPELASQMKAIFPTGIPDHPDDLTSEQRRALCEQGAGIVLFLLGEIRTIYRSVKEGGAVHKAILSISDGDEAATAEVAQSDARKREAIVCAVEAVILQQSHVQVDTGSPSSENRVILVYGPDVDFESSCNSVHISVCGENVEISLKLIECTEYRRLQNFLAVHQAMYKGETAFFKSKAAKFDGMTLDQIKTSAAFKAGSRPALAYAICEQSETILLNKKAGVTERIYQHCMQHSHFAYRLKNDQPNDELRGIISNTLQCNGYK